MANNGQDVEFHKEIENEFATVEVRSKSTRNGERIEIFSPKLGTKIELDPLALESLTWQDDTLFSELLETPFGPEVPSG